jgi:hypothetical protein
LPAIGLNEYSPAPWPCAPHDPSTLQGIRKVPIGDFDESGKPKILSKRFVLGAPSQYRMKLCDVGVDDSA